MRPERIVLVRNERNVEEQCNTYKPRASAHLRGRQLTARRVAVARAAEQTRAQVDALGGDTLLREPQLRMMGGTNQEMHNIMNDCDACKLNQLLDCGLVIYNVEAMQRWNTRK